MALLALGELGGDEFRGSALHDLLVVARGELVEELAVAQEVACLQQAGADGHVGLGLPDALGDRACGMADLEPHVPQAIEDRFGDRLAPGSLLVRQQEQEIDVGAGGQHAAPIAAGGDDRHVLRFGQVLGGIEMLGRELEQYADDLVLHEAEPLGATPSVPVLDQQLLGGGAAFHQRGFELAGDGEPQLALVAAMGDRQCFKLGRDGGRVEDLGVAQALVDGREHDVADWIAEAARRVTGDNTGGETRAARTVQHPGRRVVFISLLAPKYGNNVPLTGAVGVSKE